jgi:hypothetical protein
LKNAVRCFETSRSIHVTEILLSMKDGNCCIVVLVPVVDVKGPASSSNA